MASQRPEEPLAALRGLLEKDPEKRPIPKYSPGWAIARYIRQNPGGIPVSRESTRPDDVIRPQGMPTNRVQRDRVADELARINREANLKDLRDRDRRVLGIPIDDPQKLESMALTGLGLGAAAALGTIPAVGAAVSAGMIGHGVGRASKPDATTKDMVLGAGEAALGVLPYAGRIYRTASKIGGNRGAVLNPRPVVDAEWSFEELPGLFAPKEPLRIGPGPRALQPGKQPIRVADTAPDLGPEANLRRIEMQHKIAEYAKSKGQTFGTMNLPSREDGIDAAFSARVADAYHNATPTPTDPKTIEAYKHFGEVIDEQYDFVTKELGIKMIPVTDDPYESSADMMKDLFTTNSIKVFTGGNDIHPLLTPEQNVKFRLVHDVMGHGAVGNTFGPRGEEAAFRTHAETIPDPARAAMATETRGQNSWVNFGPNSHLPVKERPFADQKSFLLPEALRAVDPSKPLTPEQLEADDAWHAARGQGKPERPAEPVAAGPVPDIVDRTVAAEHNRGTGSTFSPRGENMSGADAWAVATNKKTERMIKGETLTDADVAKYRADNAEALSKPGAHIGTWKFGGNSYMDVSTLVPDRKTALDLGAKHKQIAVRHLGKGQDVNVKEAIEEDRLNRLVATAAERVAVPGNWYSRLDDAIDAAPFEKAPPEQWLGYLRNAKGVPQFEKDLTQIEGWIETGLSSKGRDPKAPITKAELAEYAKSRGIKLKEDGLGQEGQRDEQDIQDDIDRLERRIDRYEEQDRQSAADSEDEYQREYFLEQARERHETDFYEENPVDDDGNQAVYDPEDFDEDDAMRGYEFDWDWFNESYEPSDGLQQLYDELTDLRGEMDEWSDNGGHASKYANYSEPGGTNYREVLIQNETGRAAMVKKADEIYDEIRKIRGNRAYDDDLRGNEPVRIAALEAERKLILDKKNSMPSYTSPHWDEPDVLVHLRLKDRERRTPRPVADARYAAAFDHENTLEIVEIQSDLHQAGRKHGYLGTPEPVEVAEAREKARLAYAELDAYEMSESFSYGDDVTPELQRLRDAHTAAVTALDQAIETTGYQAPTSRSVPDFPYKKTEEWVELALKRALVEATNGNYDRLTWNTGKMNADRYNLRKYVDELRYTGTKLIGFGMGARWFATT